MSSGAAEEDIYVHKRGKEKKSSEELNPYDFACSKLQLNAIPDELPCRDNERLRITEYVK